MKLKSISKHYKTILGFTLFVLFLLVEKYKIEPYYLLLLALVTVSILYTIEGFNMLNKYRKPFMLLYYKFLDWLFNGIFIYAVIFGIYFGSTSKFKFVFSDRSLVSQIITWALVLMTMIFIIKKLLVHVRLEIKLFGGKTNSDKMWTYIALYAPVLFYIMMILSTISRQFSDVEQIVRSFLFPYMLFVVATYFDLNSMLYSKKRFSKLLARYIVHLFDWFALYAITTYSILFIIPNIQINDSMGAPLLFSIPLIYLMSEIREYILSFAIKNKQVDSLLESELNG